jgi:peptide/nickel transport system substrate-binding protein
MPHNRSELRRLATGGTCFLLACGLALPACRERTDDAPAPAPLRVAFGVGPSAKAEAVSLITAMLFAEGLLSHDWNGQTEKALVEKWSWGNGRKTLHLSLKPGVRFHDNTPLTADIVVTFLKELAAAGTLGFNHVTEMKATGPLTVDLTLSTPDAFLLPELSDQRLTLPGNNDVGTGPFRVVRKDPPVETVRFDEYHDGVSALSGVNIAVYDSQRSAWAALMRRDVDVVQDVSRESVEFMKGTIRPFPIVQPFYIPILLNHRHPVLRNREVRLALVEALDRQAIIKQAMSGFGQVADAPIWPLHWAHPTPVDRHDYDPAKARTRLERAGFPIRARRNRPSSRLSFTCTVWAEDPQHERIALMVQRQLLDVGVDMEIEMAPLDEIQKRAASGKFDAILARMNSSRTLNITYQFWRSSTGNEPPILNTGYSGTNKAFDQFRLAESDADTRRAVAELVARFHDDVPAVFIAWLQVVRAVDTRFDVTMGKTPDPFASIWQWRPVRASN